MDTNNIELTLSIITLVMIGLSISIYLVSRFLQKLNEPKALTALNLSVGQITRRRRETKPGIICSLPIHQQAARHEAIPSIY